MGENPNLFDAQYETLKREPEETLGDYVLRFTKTRADKYSREDRITLARLQMELREEPMEEQADITIEALFYLEALIAADDASFTFNDVDSDKYNLMLDQRKRLLKFLKARLEARGIIPKTKKLTGNDIEQRVQEFIPIAKITKKLQDAVKKIQEEN